MLPGLLMMCVLLRETIYLHPNVGYVLLANAK